MKRKKTALIFPGIGYHTDKPLLYYGRMLAKELGYSVIAVNYGGFPRGIKDNEEKMREAFESAMKQTEEILAEEAVSPEDDILVISKSVGTAVAAAWQRKTGIKARNLYFTPVEQSFALMEKESGIVFHGTADPWVETGIVKKGYKELDLPLFITEGANHSMETGSVPVDLKTMKKIMRTCRDYLRGL